MNLISSLSKLGIIHKHTSSEKAETKNRKILTHFVTNSQTGYNDAVIQCSHT